MPGKQWLAQPACESPNEEAMTSWGWLFRAAMFGLLASACAGGQSGTETEDPSGCYAPSRAVAPNEMTSAGSVEALAASVERAATVPVHVSDAGGSTFDAVLTLTTSVDRHSAFIDERRSDDPAGSRPCSRFLRVRAIVHFDTTDGSFAEVFDGTLEKSGGQAVFFAALPLDEHAGTFDLTSLVQNTRFLRIRTTLGSQPSGQLFFDGGSVAVPPDTVPIANWP
jgi:hypothetical protein